jgi:hypothetical protein
MWQRLMPGPSAELVLDQLSRQLAVLEGARAELEAGWVKGAWQARPGDGVCLVGALVRAGSRVPGAAREVGRAVDAVYDALWASRGQPGTPAPGRLPPVPPPEVRLARVRTLTQWNDLPCRTQEEVLTLVDRAISATIMALMSAPRPAQAGVPAAVGTG